MTVAHVATGSRSAGGTTTVSPSYPAGVAAGVLAIAARVLKPQTATGTAEAGWKQRISVTGGTGTTGAGTGQTRIVVDTKILAGSESGSVTFDNATSPNSSHGVIALYSKSATALWDLTNFSSGSDSSHGTGRSASGASALSLQPGDVVLAICGSDTTTATAYTSPAITVSGITFGATTERLGAGGVTTGNDTGMMIFEATVTSGTASANPSLSLSGGPSNCGPVVFYRLREVEPPAVTGDVTYVDSTTTGDTANTSSRAPAVPANPQPYDVVLVNLSRWASPNSNPAVTLPDSGWVALGASTGADGDQRNDRYARRIDDEIPFGTYTFSWSGSQWTTAHATMYRGVDRDVDLTTLAGLSPPQSVIATNSGTTFPVLTINSVPEGSALHWHGTSETVSPGHTVPTGWTEVEENDCDVTAYQESVAAGNYTTNASAVGVNSDSNPSSMIALPPEPAGGLSASVTTATETDSAIALAGISKKALSPTATEADTAKAFAAITKKALSPTATETDSAIAIAGRSKKSLSPVATETDTARTLASISIKAVPTSAETDAAQALIRRKSKGISTSTETDAARIITRLTGFQTATETDAAIALGRLSLRSVPTSTEADSARSLTGVRSRLVPIATEADTGRPVGTVSLRAVPVATETSLALALGRTSTVVVIKAAEVDTAQSLGRSKRKAVGLASEADTARVLSRAKVKLLGTSTEVDTAIVLVGKKKLVLVAATEIDLARDIVSGPTVFIDISVMVGPTRKRQFVMVGETRQDWEIDDTRQDLNADETRARELLGVGSSRERKLLDVGATRQDWTIEDTRPSTGVDETILERG